MAYQVFYKRVEYRDENPAFSDAGTEWAPYSRIYATKAEAQSIVDKEATQTLVKGGLNEFEIREVPDPAIEAYNTAFAERERIYLETSQAVSLLKPPSAEKDAAFEKRAAAQTALEEAKARYDEYLAAAASKVPYEEEQYNHSD